MAIKDYMAALKEAEEQVKQLTDHNNKLKMELMKKEKEMDFWITRADEGGGIDFTDGGICGISSNALVLFASNRKKPEADQYPRDLDDWRRCERTIKSIPYKEWLVRLFDLSSYPGWMEWDEKLILAITSRMMELRKADEPKDVKNAQSRK